MDPIVEAGLGRVAIVEFDSQAQLMQDFSGNSDKTTETLKALQPGDGGAAILDAVDYSVKLLEKAPRERQRVLLLISETRDHGSHEAKVDDVVAAIGQSNPRCMRWHFRRRGRMCWTRCGETILRRCIRRRICWRRSSWLRKR